MTPTRCKFVCQSVQELPPSNDGEVLYNARFTPVTDGTEEDKQFWKWTPAGVLEFASIRSKQFEPGKKYYVDVSEAP